MYPQKIFLGLTLYDILICIGIVVCFGVFGHLADKRALKGRLQNFALISGGVSIALGIGSAILFQALYNIKSNGGFEISESTGATFYGGLIGGVAAFLAIYFSFGGVVFGKTDDKDYHKKHFFDIASCGIPAVVIAHAFGRLGCLTAGCCHGAQTNAWYGIMMYGTAGYAKYVPVQLFEAIFLFALFGFLFMRAREGKGYHLSLYMAIYGAWRFCAEIARADYRGSIGIDALTPSQLIAILMAVGALAVFALEKKVGRKGAQMERENEASIEEGNEEDQ
jgi:phosphatidylglycerol:prolipoprotein diacylglycerol transferase